MTNQLRLLFLFVVISGALCTVEDYVIMSQCAHNKAIYLAAEGTVSVTDISQTQNITIVGRPDFVNNNFKIALYAKETQRYLCFNDHWKLVGMKELQDTCYFNEAIVHGYFVFRSVVDLQRRIGFTQRGRAVGPKKSVNDACYMFTKIPTDQFFHQHTHFSAPTKTKSTTKIPKTEYTNTPYSIHPGRGSGGGRPKQNRPKNQHRLEATVPSHLNTKKNKNKQRNGNKQRQQKQDMQQIRGHSYNLSNPKNSTNLNSSRQNLELSQHSITNHTKSQQHNNNNTNQHHHHPPPNHQVRHHHNDPNKVARRQQHDQKQKTKVRQRVRPSPSAATAAATSSRATTASSTLLSTSKTIHSSKPQYATTSTSYAEINPTSVVQQISTDASANRNALSSTVVVTKRKGRRRKNDKLHKKGLQKKQEPDHSAELARLKSQNWRHDSKSYTSSVEPATLPSYDDEEFMSSSTDYAWINNDIMLSSVKPTSASLPTWETWYPSSSASYSDEDTDYSLSTSVTAASITAMDTEKRYSTTLVSSSMTDIDKNTLSLQTSLPLPTSVFTTITTQTENNIDETISPTVTTDLGTTTINTSTNTQSDFWSTTSLIVNGEDDLDANEFVKDTAATPNLDEAQSTVTFDSYFEEANVTDNKDDSDNATTTVTAAAEDVLVSTSNTQASTEVSETTWDTKPAKTSISEEETSSMMAEETTPTYTNDCANSTASIFNGSKTTTDCMYATKTAPIANNHKNSRHRNASFNNETPKRNFIENSSEKKLETVSRATTSIIFETTPTRNDKTTTTTITTSLPESPQQPPPLSPPSSSATPTMQYHSVPKHDTTLSTADNTQQIQATPTLSSTTILSSRSSLPPSPSTTRKTLRKSTQRLLATPFHQLTYVRNEAGDIDIDSIDNISIYPELLDNDNDETVVKSSTSRLTMISGYLPTSATATLPESIRIAKIKINRERKRILRLRSVGNYA